MTRRWKCGASLALPLAAADEPWDSEAATARVLEFCGFGGPDPDVNLARKAFLAYNFELYCGSRKLCVAVRDGHSRQADGCACRHGASRAPPGARCNSARRAQQGSGSARGLFENADQPEARRTPILGGRRSTQF